MVLEIKIQLYLGRRFKESNYKAVTKIAFAFKITFLWTLCLKSNRTEKSF